MPDIRPAIIAKRPPRRVRRKSRRAATPKSGRTTRPTLHGITESSPQGEIFPSKPQRITYPLAQS